jgi:hypothetical protein
MYGQHVAPMIGRCMKALPLAPLSSSILQPPGSFIIARKNCWRDYFNLRKSEAAYKQRSICSSILFRCLIWGENGKDTLTPN